MKKYAAVAIAGVMLLGAGGSSSAQAAGATPSAAGVDVVAKSASSGSTVAARRPVKRAKISVKVYADRDRDGRLDRGEKAVKSTKVNLLTSNGRVVRTARTTRRGQISFSGLAAGIYKVKLANGRTSTVKLTSGRAKKTVVMPLASTKNQAPKSAPKPVVNTNPLIDNEWSNTEFVRQFNLRRDSMGMPPVKSVSCLNTVAAKSAATMKADPSYDDGCPQASDVASFGVEHMSNSTEKTTVGLFYYYASGSFAPGTSAAKYIGVYHVQGLTFISLGY